jgi:ATP adenylyltransferase
MARRSREQLWAPWRLRYIQKADEPPGCLFCRVASTRTDRPNMVLARRPNALLMLNKYPYNPGHLMVAIKRHAARFAALKPEERHDLMDLAALAEESLTAEYQPHGMNYGANVGRVAGAGFPKHLHLHIVPRWNGDTNFMPTIAETKVLPESLARTWTRLRRAVKSIEKAGRG